MMGSIMFTIKIDGNNASKTCSRKFSLILQQFYMIIFSLMIKAILVTGCGSPSVVG
jgi:hypothetical protein